MRASGKLDKEVKKCGMFKYQHVATGSKHSFIVCCPRASCPNNAREQRSDYPADYVRTLFFLAFDMIDLVQTSTGWPLTQDAASVQELPGVQVRVGLSRGPIATIVLGICRRYYGIYGNTVNMGARMAQNAEYGTVCIDADLATFVGEEDFRGFVLKSRGEFEVKGKGALELFQVRLPRVYVWCVRACACVRARACACVHLERACVCVCVHLERAAVVHMFVT